LALHWHEKSKDGTEGEDTLCLVITTNEIVHDIGVPDAFCNLFLVANVPFLLLYWALFSYFLIIIKNAETENAP
jgi:hypothetical protein